MIRPIVERVGDELKINLFPKQAQFINSDVDDILFGGAASGGKSAALLVFKAIRRMSHPGSNGLLLRRTYSQLEKSLILKSREIYPLFGATYHESKKLWSFPNGSLEHFGYLERDADVLNYHCFHPETELLTINGWRFVADIRAGDLVSTMNPATREMDYRPATKIYSYEYSGKMLSLYQKDGVSFCVTPNHSIWASTERTKSIKRYEAKDLPKVAMIPQTIKWKGIRPPEKFSFQSDGHNGKKVEFNSRDWCSFLGWYLAEGCCNPTRWSIRISQIKKYGRKLVEDILRRNGINAFINKREISFSSKALCFYLQTLGKDCYEKKITPDIKSWDSEHLQIILDALVDGDGTWYKRGNHPHYYGVFVTSSVTLKDDVTEIALKCGYRVTSALVDGYLTKGKTKIWRLYLLKKRGDTSVRSTKSKIEEIYYFGSIYCVNVPPYHTVLTRHRNRISWSGQSDEYHDIGFDEASLFSEFQINYMTSRCRSTLSGCKALIRLASNPGNVGHMFLKKRYIEPSKKQPIWTDEITGKTYSFISAKIDDNPAMLELDPGYKDRLRVLGDQKYMALAEGNWDVFEGTYFDFDIRPGHGVLPYRRVPDTDTFKFLSLDWGYAEPACVLWWELMPSGRLIAYRELYVTRLSPKELAQKIMDMSPVSERYEHIACPPEIWGKKIELDGGGESIQSLMQTVFSDRIPMIKAPNARIPGWLKLKEYMSKAGDGRPWLQLSPVCENTIRTIPAMIYRSEERGHGNVEDLDDRGEDHCADSCRYAVMTLQNSPQSTSEIISPYERLFGRTMDSKSHAYLPDVGRGGY